MISETRPGFETINLNSIGRDSPKDKFVCQVQIWVGIIQERKKMVRAIFLEKEIVEVGIPQFPRMHQKSTQLSFA